MTRGWCPDCDTLREIVDTKRRRHPNRGTDSWWSVVVHSDGRGGICAGSGKLL